MRRTNVPRFVSGPMMSAFVPGGWNPLYINMNEAASHHSAKRKKEQPRRIAAADSPSKHCFSETRFSIYTTVSGVI